MLKLFRLWMNRSRMSDVERYLSNSSDLVDLEQRQQSLARKGVYY